MPCDLVVLKTASTAPPVATQCFLETSNLDGESNLKTRMVSGGDGRQGRVPLLLRGGVLLAQAPLETASMTVEELVTLRAHVECPPPNGDLYSFDSTLYLCAPGSDAGCLSAAPDAAGTLTRPCLCVAARAAN